MLEHYKIILLRFTLWLWSRVFTYIYIIEAGLGEIETTLIRTWKLLEMIIDESMEESNAYTMRNI